MASYNPFAAKAGLKKIAEQQPLPGVLKIADLLVELDFNLQLLGSEQYLLKKINTLLEEDVKKLKRSFVGDKLPRFKKESAISRHQPFGKTADYVKC